MSSISTTQAFGSAARWMFSALRGKGNDFYCNHPKEYEQVARVLLGREEVAQSIQEIVEREATPHSRRLAVDAACGTGIITDALKGSAKRVIGMDICREAIEYARASKHPSLEFEQTDLHDFTSFESESIDVFSLSFAHRYIEDLQLFYSELARSLAPDGVAVITTAYRQKTFDAVQEQCDEVGLLMRILQPQFRSLFNRVHRTSHIILKQEPGKKRVSTAWPLVNEC